MSKSIKVAIADDYKILREALINRFNAEGFTLSGEADDTQGALALAKEGKADVLLLEPLIPQEKGIDLTSEILRLKSKTKIMILTMDSGDHNAFRMLRAGASGWLPKTCGIDEVVTAVREVHNGRVYLPTGLQQTFAERYVRPENVRQPEEKLSEREYQVMRMLAAGDTNREISTKLGIGVKTVDTHRANLLRKLELRNNADLTRFAIKHGLIQP